MKELVKHSDVPARGPHAAEFLNADHRFARESGLRLSVQSPRRFGE